VAAGGLLIVFSMWWIYFDLPTDVVVGSARAGFADRRWGAFVWGYGHLVVFASAAAVGAGLAVAVDQAADHGKISATGAALAVSVPVSVYLVSVWVLHARYKAPGFVRVGSVPIAVAVILAASFTAESVLVTGCVLVLLIVVSTARRARGGAVTVR
jgi:low temperature requirement protein LtrA